MSKLDDMITEFAKSCFGEIHVDKDDEFKQQIKDLMLELIDDDWESLEELRQKVNAL